MLRVKICGITRPEDALLAAELGADAVGLIFYPRSPRFIRPERAAEIVSQLPDGVARVGVFVDTPVAEIHNIARMARLTVVQFHGPYTAEDLAMVLDYHRLAVVRIPPDADATWKAIDKEITRNCEAVLLDAQVNGQWGGTGRSFRWELARSLGLNGRFIVAGGLNPDNVRRAVEVCQPYGVDVSSGVESEPGKKDPAKLERLFHQLKEYRRGWQRTESPVFPIA